MLRNKPRLGYVGLTVVLSNPSRFDTINLLSATGGSLFNDWCLRPDYNVMQVDIRLADDATPLLPGTKCVLLCGEYAMHKYLKETHNNTINEMRGSPFVVDGIVYIPTFVPQDAADIKFYEQASNPLSKDYQPDATDYEDDEEGDVKRHGKTAHRNYAFWLRSDVSKAKQVLANGGKIPSYPFPEPKYHIWPSSKVVIDVLQSKSNCFLWFDMETDFEEQNLQCFSFSFDGCNIYCVPILNENYKPAYTNYHHILRALAIGIRQNTIVAHNGAAFDFQILGFKYRIPIGKSYDTMLAMHRCFPDVEKSLGHGISYWTWEKFHKDEDAQAYVNKDQVIKRLQYCGKDVYTMFLVHQAIEKYAKKIPGLQSSIDTAMSAIRPYLITSIQGIRYTPEKVSKLINENDRLMMQYNRLAMLLVGEKGYTDIRNRIKGKPKLFAGSSKQCIIYFHDLLGYPVVARSKKSGEPSLSKGAMYKLALSHEDNPVIQLILAYRRVQKEYGAMNFLPWKDDDGNIVKEQNENKNEGTKLP